MGRSAELADECSEPALRLHQDHHTPACFFIPEQQQSEATMITASYGGEKPLVIRISFTTCALVIVCLPLLGLLSCVIISSVFHFEDSTYTHCQVPNYLPSISASISLSPECHIWRLCVGLHSAPRLLVAFTYFKFYKVRFASRLPESSLAYLSLAFSISENLGLLLLTYVSSNETYFVHKEGFILFILSSFVYMIITCRLWKAIKTYSLNPEDARSHHWKVSLLILNLSFCAFAGLFYVKHNLYCESGSYTLFALFEYLIVFSNMAFHLTAAWDFKSREVMVISCSEPKGF
ncbi:post-GPI attachment to proteins factor 2-like isoform X1 [Syngnathus typhle]|uniref:post-GPI attachment to proteins factor 2-like isoform X1 n=1 Tax=Syngnathus typhle TaxID=161592 RepID=UPI002A6A9D02|nr:post-GPI attachment to proteins factor 2-like isoform X1 [Syngnathus typhle]XP_061136173.1 post-GPI attachment to proteins factor 2-like isoform X1 [Syngnathus typhle]XP_061136194.1 post-GPI attachment to proteins factor 2-like isoform X1 [Syngnathus typhle]XP_061136195.1 post-GPI attachment to proteins factor 2-like isoform X1 [Syngnathus typhle]